MTVSLRRWAPLVAISACLSTGAAIAETSSVEVDAATQQRLGVVVAPLVSAVHHSGGANGFARVLDPGPLAALDADIAAAAAASAASKAEADRTRALHAADASISAKVMEAAAAQARADAAKLTLLRRRVGLEWGAAIGRLSDGQRSALVAELAAGRAALVRIDTASGEGQAAPKSAELDLGTLGKATAVVLGPAKTAEARLQSPGLIGKVGGAQAQRLSVGLIAPVHLAGGAAQSGVVIPRGALLRTEGATFAYVRTAPNRFERREVVGGIADPAGLFVGGGFRAGELAAVAGGAALITAEHKSAEGEKGAD